MAQKIRLTESELNEIVAQVLKEEMEEGFMDRLKSGYNSFMGNGVSGQKRGTINLADRWNAAKVGYNMQNHIDNKKQAYNFIKSVMNQYRLTPQSTIQQLLNRLEASQMNAGKERKIAQQNIYNRDERLWNDKVERLNNGTGGNSKGLNSAKNTRGNSGYGAVQL